jgi:Mrp family chromosome partitioning ATPase
MEERMDHDQMMEEPSLAQQSSEIAHVVGVMSGKGGVGKSLVTGLLASAFRRVGKSVGILDADITGPSIPKMFGMSGRPEVNDLGIFPPETETGIKVISINLFLDRPEDAVIWRGPMISGTVKQFWTDVFWGKLDYLFVDLPPGTADVPLTVIQSLPLECVAIVTSPQDLAAMVVGKAVNMCRTMGVPILGLVQNMAYLKCPSCEERIYPFGRSDGEALARKMGVPFLLDLPIDSEISHRADAGTMEHYAGNLFTDKIEAISNGIDSLSFAKSGGLCPSGDPRS